MRRTLRLLPLLALMASPTLEAIVIGGSASPQAQPAQPAAQQPTQPTAQPFAHPGAAPNAMVTNEQIKQLESNPQAAQAAVANMVNAGHPKMSPEVARQLGSSLNSQQMEALAKNYQPQIQGGGAQVAITPADEAESFHAPAPVASTKVVAIEKPREKSLDEIKRDEAFNMLVEDVLPLSPDQIERLHKYYDLTLQARATPPSPPPTPQFSSIRVNLEPGSSPPVIRLATGFVSSLLFVDSTGAAWPLTAYSIGDPQAFNIQWDQKSNALFVQSLKQYSHGNLAVRLHHLDTPIMITLVSGQRNVDFRVDLQVPGRGPDARPAVVETVINAKVNPILMNILDGVPPTGSIKLEVAGGPGDAWLNDDKIYFRTKLTVLSPAWLGTVSSLDGTHVYEMMITPYIMASHEGKTVNIKISGL